MHDCHLPLEGYFIFHVKISYYYYYIANEIKKLYVGEKVHTNDKFNIDFIPLFVKTCLHVVWDLGNTNGRH
ncbi:hypothetical protein AM500_20325 [Bacillus sp. FJAT-18017]|nr:hypothetical protein AM500_20325 [Bacillus sp. FJAT-18017]